MPDLQQVLESQVTPERIEKIERVVANRTYGLTVVLEDIFQGHNAAAVLRSCECFGVQNIHCVELRNEFRPSDEVSMGAHKWLDIYRYGSTVDAIERLKADGYRTVATTLREGAVPVGQLPTDKPIALVFGTELTGLSQQAHQACDNYAYLPMVGFTQSFNISVSVALCLQLLTQRLANEPFFRLTPQQTDALRLSYLKRSVPHYEKIMKHLANTGSGDAATPDSA